MAILWKKVSEGVYRAELCGRVTEYTAERNDNEPESSPLRWQILKDGDLMPLYEGGTRKFVTTRLERLLLSKPGRPS